MHSHSRLPSPDPNFWKSPCLLTNRYSLDKRHNQHNNNNNNNTRKTRQTGTYKGAECSICSSVEQSNETKHVQPQYAKNAHFSPFGAAEIADFAQFEAAETADFGQFGAAETADFGPFGAAETAELWSIWGGASLQEAGAQQ